MKVTNVSLFFVNRKALLGKICMVNAPVCLYARQGGGVVKSVGQAFCPIVRPCFRIGIRRRKKPAQVLREERNRPQSCGDKRIWLSLQRNIYTQMLEIKNLHASVEGKEILRGVNLTIRDGEVHVLMGPNGSGKSTLSNVLVGNPKYEVTKGSVVFNGKDLLSLSPEDRSHEGVFMSFQAPTEIPGVSMTNFMRAALNAKRKYFGMEPMTPSEFLKLLKEKRKLVGLDAHFMSRGVNEGFSGGERKRNEIFQMAVLDPLFSILDETDSGLDVDALRIVAEGFNMLRSAKTSAMVITHYQRMLDYLKPDYVHVLVDGQIVRNGGAELGYEIEEKGFDWIKEQL